MKINLFPWRQFIAALILLALPLVVQAQFAYVTNSDGSSITITGYNGPGGALIIPFRINGHLVTDIANDAFADNSNITSITITNAFVLFDLSIGASAFMGCSGLTSVYLGNTVTNIGDFAFADCTNLTSVYFGEFYFLSDQRNDNIGADAFTFCTSVANVYIGGTVTNIGDSAFAYCTSLSSVAIQNTNITIGSLAFAYCTNVAAYFNGNAPLNNGSVFYGDPGAVVYYPSGTTGWGATFGGAPTAQTPASEFSYEEPYYGASTVDITSYNGPGGTVMIPPFINGYPVTGIGYDGTYGVFPNYVTNVIIPITVTSIGEEAFQQSGLTSITIPDSVTSIGFDAFQFCTRLTNVTVANGVTSIEPEAFYGCGLTSVTIPASVTAIGYGPFADCTNLTNISVDAASLSYTSLDGVLFDKAQDTLIQYPAGLTSSTYTLPGSVTGIGESAFYRCINLTSVTIPGSVTNVEGYAFQYCTSLTSAYFEGNAPPDDGTIFNGDPVTVVYYLSGTTGWVASFGGAPTELWLPTVSSFEPSFGVQNHQFSFLISWAPNTSVIVQACTNLANPNWIPVATNSLNSGTNYFSDAQWTNYPCRFYRISGP
jgi:BspA type Leucine rich repeat region (6 copies)